MGTKLKNAMSGLKKAFLVTVVLLILCGLIYPLVLTGISQVIFPKQANGSVITVDGKQVGSELVGQDFTDERFMKCRPSSVNYNTNTQEDVDNGDHTMGAPSSGSNNYAPSNPELAERVQADIDAFLEENPDVKKEDIPTDLLTASGSGLDPHISPESAEIQIPRLVETTKLSEDELKQIVKDNTNGKFLGIFGEETVNVLGVNLDIAEKLGMIGSEE